MNVIVKVQTALEGNDSISDALDWKLQQIQNSDLPMEQGLADYIALGVGNIEEKINELKNYKKMIDSEIRQLNDHKSTVSVECAKWIQSQGLDKLNGVAVSSVTITKGTAEKKIKKANLTHYTYNGFHYDGYKELLKKLEKDEVVIFQYGKDIEEIKPATEDKIRINKKRSTK